MFRNFFGRKAKLDKAFQRYQELYIQRRYAEAEPFAADALRLGQEEFGIDDPNTAVFTNNLAIVLKALGKFAEAEPLYEAALAIQEKVLAADHPELANSLNNLAVLFKDQGKLGEAEPLMKRALTIMEEALGPDDPDVAMFLESYAELLQSPRRRRHPADASR